MARLLKKLCPAFQIVHVNLTEEVYVKIEKHGNKKCFVSLDTAERSKTVLSLSELFNKNSFSLLANPNHNPQIKQTLRFLG